MTLTDHIDIACPDCGNEGNLVESVDAGNGEFNAYYCVVCSEQYYVTIRPSTPKVIK